MNRKHQWHDSVPDDQADLASSILFCLEPWADTADRAGASLDVLAMAAAIHVCSLVPTDEAQTAGDNYQAAFKHYLAQVISARQLYDKDGLN